MMTGEIADEQLDIPFDNFLDLLLRKFLFFIFCIFRRVDFAFWVFASHVRVAVCCSGQVLRFVWWCRVFCQYVISL
jgi:hypothetical protein